MLAWITPVYGPGDPGYFPPGIGGPGSNPPGIWPGPHPSHPIMLPGMPGWGSGGQPPLGIWGPPQMPPPTLIPGWPGGWPGLGPGGGPIYPPVSGGQPVDPAYGIPITGRPIIGGGPIYPPPQGGGWGPDYIWGGGPGARPPIAPIPPSAPGDTVPVDPGFFPPGVAVPVPPESGGTATKAYVVAYTMTPSGPQRVTFVVELPVYINPIPPVAEPKPVP